MQHKHSNLEVDLRSLSNGLFKSLKSDGAFMQFYLVCLNMRTLEVIHQTFHSPVPIANGLRRLSFETNNTFLCQLTLFGNKA